MTRTLAVVILAAGAALALASPARAQTAPAPAPPPAPAQATPAPPAPAPAPLSQTPAPLMQTVIPQSPCPAASSPATPSTDLASYPIGSYTIDYDEGGFTAISRKAVGSLTEMTFATVRWVVGVGVWLVGWAFSFGFANRLAGPMAAVAGRYQQAFFVPLLGFALLLSAAYGGVQIFRGRIGRGVAEFALSLLLVTAFATWLLANPQGFLNGSFSFTAQLAGSVASVALPPAPAGCSAPPGSYALPQMDAAVGPLTDQIDNAFVRQPYELLEWGTIVPPACRTEADAVLAAGSGGDRDQIVSVMDTPPCVGLYTFNRQPSTDRLGVAVLVLAASVILMLSLGLVAGTVILAQLVAVILIAVMPFAALAAALPGAGRSIMWLWATAFVRALVTIVAMSAFLTFLLLAGDALLASGQGQSLL
ncbi:MAG TPA: hypothetical protein VKY26_03480, partial [Actinomycetota bacterium]|nr:hypothetical protein [Actinomycetota bacterium]